MSAGAKLQDVRDLIEQFAPGGKLEEKFYQIPIDALRPSPLNPRKQFDREKLEELAASIREKGILQPLTARPRIDVDEHALDSGRIESWEIVIGERRWRAAKLAGASHVPCLVRMMDDEAVLDAQITENLQRDDVSPLEEAAAFQARLKAAGDAGHKMKVADLAKTIGKCTRWVYDRIELLKLSETAKAELLAEKISPGHATEIARLAPHLQDMVLHAIQRESLTVIGLRRYIKYLLKPASQTSAKRRAMPTEAQKAAYLRSSGAGRGLQTSAKVTREAIERRLRQSLPEVLRLLHVSTAKEKMLRDELARRIAEWFAELVQTSAKARRRAR